MNKKLNNKQLLLYHMPIVLLLFLIKENLLYLIRDIANNDNYSINAVIEFKNFNEIAKKHSNRVLYVTFILRYTHELLWHIKRANRLNEIEFEWLKSRFQKFYVLYYEGYRIK